MPVRSRYSRKRRWRRNRRRRGPQRRYARGGYRWRRKNGIFNARLQTEETLTVASAATPSWCVGHVNVTLKSMMPKGPGTTTNLYGMPFSYYRIRKLKIEFLPQIGITSNRSYGGTAIILDGDYISEGKNQTYDPLANHSSRHNLTNIHRHSRYFTPKPQHSSKNISTYFQPNNKQLQEWISMNQQDRVHHGLQYSIQNSNFIQTWTIRKTAYVQFREFDLVNFPKQT